MNIFVLGAGPCGLGSAQRLTLQPCSSWQAFERNSFSGGLSASFADSCGFTWDVGGHVLFSHFDYFDLLVDKALEEGYFEHMRESWVRMLDTWIPYPFQNNIRYLPTDAQKKCLDGLKELTGTPGDAKNFKQWMNAVFGEGIVQYFMEPYNFKVWATPPELMSKNWIAERVSIVDLERVERNIAEELDDISWGPNNKFKFPQKGGTGAIWQGIASPFENKIMFNHELSCVELENKRLSFSNGSQCEYDKLISTIPIDQFVKMCDSVPDEVRTAADQLVHNSVYVVGVGVEAARDDSKCWMYFPEDNCPFYRVTNFHNYSPHNVPGGRVDKYSAFMCETSYSAFKPVSKETVIEETIQGLINTGMMIESERGKIVSTYLIDVPYAYPVPTIERDNALGIIQPFLESHDIYSRGRFGAWKYEIGNMDHSFMQGVEIAERLMSGKKETVFNS